jgi:hypothetical protein
MSSISASPPNGLTLRLLRLQYWYDRLTEPQRLFAGLAAILVLASTWLYLLGLGSWVLVNRAEELGPSQVDQTLVEAPQALAPETAAQPAPTVAPTPATETNANLIQPPEIEEVPIVPPAPRAIVPVEPLKPRVMATMAPTASRPAPAAPPVQQPAPARQSAPAPQQAAPPARANGPGASTNSGAGSTTQAPARPAVAPTAAPKPPAATATPARAAAPTPTPRR